MSRDCRGLVDLTASLSLTLQSAKPPTNLLLLTKPPSTTMGRKQNIPKPADAQNTQNTQTQKGAPEKNAKQEDTRPTSGKGAAKEKNKGATKKGNRR